MLRTLIRLSDGTEIFSGSNADMNIRSCTITQCCNSGEELTIGSVCAAYVEMVVEAPTNTFRSEDIFTLYKVDDTGNETQIGIFNVFEPEKKSDRLYKVTAYDNVIKLDTDLSEWLNEKMAEVSGAPNDFVRAVCNQCGVRLSDDFPTFSQHHYVDNFSTQGTVTGRRLLQWVAEIMCCFCIALPNGELCLRWYSDRTNVLLSASGDRYRLQGSYKFRNHILAVDAVRIVRDDGTYVQYPSDYSPGNPYIIKDNPILNAKEDQQDVHTIAEEIIMRLDHDSIMCSQGDDPCACEVSTPASLDVNVGDIIAVDEQEQLQDEIPLRIYMRVMTKIQKGQKDTLYCTGSYRRRN